MGQRPWKTYSSLKKIDVFAKNSFHEVRWQQIFPVTVIKEKYPSRFECGLEIGVFK